MSVTYLLSSSNLGDTITISLGDNSAPLVVRDNHINYERIRSILENTSDPDPEHIRELADSFISISNFLSESSDREMSISGTKIVLDGQIIDGPLAAKVIQYYQEKNHVGIQSLIRFIDKAINNLGGTKSINSLWSWINERNFTITDDGNFIAYKGVVLQDKEFVSVHSGNATSNGVFYKNARIPNPIGAVVTMPRDQVNDDTSVGCSRGLHAGSWQYASGFGKKVLAVEIDPRNVVSVPSDSNFQKLRVCEYKVLAVAPDRLEADEKELIRV